MADEVQITQSVIEAVGQKTGDANVEITQSVLEASGLHDNVADELVEVTQVALELAYCAVPRTPTSLLATASTGSSVDLSWAIASSDAEIRIERSTDGVVYAEIATVVAGSTAYADTTILYDVLYYYSIRHYLNAECGYSTYSNIASALATSIPLCEVIYTLEIDYGAGWIDKSDDLSFA